MNERFLRACRRQPVDCTPVWIMRQAGRYLPEYRKVRAASDFLTMCKTPSLAAEVSLQPVDILGVDAAIIFSDILVIPEAMGMGLEMVEGQGPLLSPPIRKPGDISSLHAVDPEKDLRFLLDAIEGTKRGLNGKVPLIGFTGSPWTLASYMVEGRGTRDFATIKEMMIDEPSTLTLLLEKLTTAVRLSLEAQIGAGRMRSRSLTRGAGYSTPIITGNSPSTPCFPSSRRCSGGIPLSSSSPRGHTTRSRTWRASAQMWWGSTGWSI